MIRIPDTRLHVGGKVDAELRHDDAWAVVNTAKTVHCEIMGWGNRPPSDHPKYVELEDGQLLSFNWVDGAAYLFDFQDRGVERFTRALDFIDRWYPTKDILINCDQGQSRSPTVALLYLAKRLGTLPDTSFAHARESFQVIYPPYAPKGIADFVSTSWNEIR
ncbi:MAG: hypothetical protein CVT64_02725 [Actinobacteria bacterium HGW-Actinobacteria-4]|nr:MAG: hypothetical protein CVT64_02725 [Actinobacteria bacterium HGW-Actinobacteria-4]